MAVIFSFHQGQTIAGLNDFRDVDQEILPPSLHPRGGFFPRLHYPIDVLFFPFYSWYAGVGVCVFQKKGLLSLAVGAD